MGTIKDFIRQLDRFQQGTDDLDVKTVTIITDGKGMIGKQCNKDGCYSLFKVNAQDWRNIVKEEVFCPFYRHRSSSSDFFPTDLRSDVLSTSIGHVEKPAIAPFSPRLPYVLTD